MTERPIRLPTIVLLLGDSNTEELCARLVALTPNSMKENLRGYAGVYLTALLGIELEGDTEDQFNAAVDDFLEEKLGKEIMPKAFIGSEEMPGGTFIFPDARADDVAPLVAQFGADDVLCIMTTLGSDAMAALAAGVKKVWLPMPDTEARIRTLRHELGEV